MLFEISKIFDSLTEITDLEQECNCLLTRLLEIKNPMKFDDTFATDEQLNQLETYLDNKSIGNMEAESFKSIINSLPPALVQGFVFI